MLGLSKKSRTPTTYYALTFCIHIVAFILMVVGIFTPYWSEIIEQVGDTTSNYVYDRGLVLSCSGSGNCETNKRLTEGSDVFFAAFVLGIFAVIFGFFILQMFAAGILIKSCRDTNLGLAIAVTSIVEGAVLALVLVLFEISIGEDETPGNRHREDDFGFSRGLIILAIFLYWLAAIFIMGEYVRRKPSPVHQPAFQQRHHVYPRRLPPEMASPIYKASALKQEPAPSSYRSKPPKPDKKKKRNQEVGMKACRLEGCASCYFVAESPTVWGPGGVYNINEPLTCQDSGIVFAIICARDEKVFIGHTSQTLEDTFKAHLTNIKAVRVCDPVAYHFTSPGHSLDDIRVTALSHLNCGPDDRSRLERALRYDMSRPRDSYYGFNNTFEFL